ncbi:MAG: hypothetical protein ACLPT6_04390 [Desulfobaccales bacterium]
MRLETAAPGKIHFRNRELKQVVFIWFPSSRWGTHFSDRLRLARFIDRKLSSHFQTLPKQSLK